MQQSNSIQVKEAYQNNNNNNNNKTTAHLKRLLGIVGVKCSDERFVDWMVGWLID